MCQSGIQNANPWVVIKSFIKLGDELYENEMKIDSHRVTDVSHIIDGCSDIRQLSGQHCRRIAAKMISAYRRNTIALGIYGGRRCKRVTNFIAYSRMNNRFHVDENEAGGVNVKWLLDRVTPL